jgi:iron(II)-dependent oxidoreductase
VFDNEKWSHPVPIRPFDIARAPVTQGQFADFVDDGGYRRPGSWDAEGWRWREANDARHPVYWRRASGGGWDRRDFDRWVPLEPHRPVRHVCWYEADAYCRWAGRRLPSEAEWEAAATTRPAPEGCGLSSDKTRFPWGQGPPSPSLANLDGLAPGCRDVGALPLGDSALGCRQMIGNVWEWTRSDFLPYPGFVVDPYKEYSEPWFGTHKVLRGGCWATRSRLIRATWRNFYRPDRRDVVAGFRTCGPGR